MENIYAVTDIIPNTEDISDTYLRKLDKYHNKTVDERKEIVFNSILFGYWQNYWVPEKKNILSMKPFLPVTEESERLLKLLSRLFKTLNLASIDVTLAFTTIAENILLYDKFVFIQLWFVDAVPGMNYEYFILKYFLFHLRYLEMELEDQLKLNQSVPQFSFNREIGNIKDLVYNKVYRQIFRLRNLRRKMKRTAEEVEAYDDAYENRPLY